VSKTGWKQVERDAAACLGSTRHWANEGGRVDVKSDHFAAQVKNPAKQPLAELTRLVEEMTVLGIDTGRVPVVLVKESCRRPTPLLAVLPAQALQFIWETLICHLTDLPAWRRALCSKLADSPKLRKAVAEYVEKSKKRARRPGKKTRE